MKTPTVIFSCVNDFSYISQSATTVEPYGDKTEGIREIYDSQ